jgi:hypothetical protein
MNAAQIKAMYAAQLREIIKVRRYTGTGTNRPLFEVSVRGKDRLYGATEFLGPIVSGDHNVLLFADDLIAKKFALPLTTNDKVVVAGREFSILAPNTRKAPDGTLIVYDLQARFP